MIYKIMPRVRIAWHDVWIGAAVTSLLFTVGKLLIGLYIGRSGISSGFGAAGSLVVVLVWVYYSAQIFLFGAEFTWVYSHRFGSRRGQGRSRHAGRNRRRRLSGARRPRRHCAETLAAATPFGGTAIDSARSTQPPPIAW